MRKLLADIFGGAWAALEDPWVCFLTGCTMFVIAVLLVALLGTAS